MPDPILIIDDSHVIRHIMEAARHREEYSIINHHGLCTTLRRHTCLFAALKEKNMFTASSVIYRQPHCIIDPATASETVRLECQHIALRTCLELLPSPLSDTLSLRLLDLACGAGDWLFDVAYELSEAEVVGIDPHHANIQYAHALARVSLSHTISCQVMDLRSELHFPPSSFDLIYGHFLSAWLTEEEWLPMLTRCRSLLRPDGVLRLIEAEDGHCSSPACEQLSSWYEQALGQSGVRAKHSDWYDLLKQAGYTRTLERAVLDFSVGSRAHSPMRKVIESFFVLIQPFVTQCGVVTKQVFEQVCMLSIIRQDY